MGEWVGEWVGERVGGCHLIHIHCVRRYANTQYVEPLQILRYTKGQEFRMHCDAGVWDEDEDTVHIPKPARVFSMIFTLSISFLISGMF